MASVKSKFLAREKKEVFPRDYFRLWVMPVLFLCFSSFSFCQQSAIPVIDFSYAGYHQGESNIPSPSGKIKVRPTGRDDTALLQAAIDHLQTFPLQKNGFRGAILLSPGTFHVDGSLQIPASGIVLRGSGDQETRIIATGKGRRTLIEAGKKNPPVLSEKIVITDNLVPAGSTVLTLEHVSGLKEGDRVAITRPSTRAWISSLGMDTLSGNFADLRYHWTEGSRNLVWDRKITSINRGTGAITIDAPITMSLEKRFGGGIVSKVTGNEPLHHIGIENLIIESEYNDENRKDEEHAWFGIVLDNVEHSWVRDVTARHFVSSAVKIGPRGRNITILNCRNEEPVSEIGGYRRHSFLVEGQQVLVEKCSADSGNNDFAIGFLATGPNVFLDCSATNALGASGSYESWATGVLYENVKVEGNDLRLTYDMNRAQGGGWTAANSVIWNCTADNIAAKGPEGSPVVVVDSPESLFRKQRIKRIGSEKLSVSAPSFGEIKEFGIKDIPSSPPPVSKKEIPFQIINGRFTTGSSVAWGGAVNDAWWLGHTSPANALDAGVSITRYVPGRAGEGLTENLPELMRKMVARKTPFYQSGPAIWYDRRRDDHSIKRRPDGNVWAAFYELPWARSGQGLAWDGLSKYDLTTYNPWYFDRTKKFAQLADENGIILYHHLYNNHNLLETASHWIDFPWRPANNINETGLPEPPPLEANDRVHLASAFYDVTNPELRELHRSYILHVLDELGHFQNIIFGLSFQYSGPVEFQRFFQETVAEWEHQNNRKIRLVIDTGKNVTDAILADPDLSKQIAVIDMRYWHYLPDGSLWAPRAGQNRAFRELHPREFGDPTTSEQIYRQVREYHDKYPEKAIVSWHAGVDPIPALMAGGAQVLMRNPTAGHGQGREVDFHPVDSFVQEHLSQELMFMEPQDEILKQEKKNWALLNPEHSVVLIYSLDGKEITWAKSLKEENFEGIWFDPRTGTQKAAILPGTIKRGTTIEKPTERAWLLLLTSLRD